MISLINDETNEEGVPVLQAGNYKYILMVKDDGPGGVAYYYGNIRLDEASAVKVLIPQVLEHNKVSLDLPAACLFYSV
ncbi:MAG: hypothetical protein IT291_06915 [Deltaproteobacteria bacterium]|nr:hypothetical protein [Deltaproteobacteria bacterium]